jgi:hypothetical protein
MNVDAATNAGMDGIIYTDFEEFVREMEKRLGGGEPVRSVKSAEPAESAGSEGEEDE